VLIIPSSLISDISGSIAGTTFKRTKAGLTAQHKVTRCPRRYSFVAGQREGLTTANRSWHNVTPALRQAWELIRRQINLADGKKNPPRFQNAEALFLSHNIPRVLFGLSVQTAAPTLAAQNMQFKENIVIRHTSPNYVFVQFNEDPLLTGEWCLVQHSRRTLISRKTPINWYPYRLFYTGPQVFRVSLNLPWTPPANTAVWFNVRRISSARLASPPRLIHLTW